MSKYIVKFESPEITDCSNCQLADIERTMVWCNVQEVGVASSENERVLREAIAELMYNCPLEEIGEQA